MTRAVAINIHKQETTNTETKDIETKNIETKEVLYKFFKMSQHISAIFKYKC